LTADQDNFRLALRTAIDGGDAEAALRLCGALWQYWRAHGDIAEGREWLRRSLALHGADVGTRAKALWGAAWLAYHHDDYDEASERGEELSALARTNDDPVVRRNALTIPGIVAMARARYEDARDLFAQAVEVLRPLGQNWLFATSLLNLGSASVRVGAHDAARAALEQARDLYERLGDRAFSARASIQIAFVGMAEGDLREAAALIGAALTLFAESEDAWGTAESLEAMAAVRAAEANARDAALLTGAAGAIRSMISMRPHPFDAEWTERYIDEARGSAGGDAWSQWLDEGSTLDIDQVLDVALRDSPSPSKKR
jgi:tetratricopeptide (TPR) repeat protein